eukprot:4066135-Amphidinium_carterae.1
MQLNLKSRAKMQVQCQRVQWFKGEGGGAHTTATSTGVQSLVRHSNRTPTQKSKLMHKFVGTRPSCSAHSMSESGLSGRHPGCRFASALSALQLQELLALDDAPTLGTPPECRSAVLLLPGNPEQPMLCGITVVLPSELGLPRAA